NYAPCLQCAPICHAVEPVGDHFSWHNGTGFAREHYKRGLESIFGIVMIAENTATNAQDHRTVAAYKRLKRRLVLVADERFQQLSISQPPAVPPKHHSAKLIDDGVQGAGHHVGYCVVHFIGLYLYLPGRSSFHSLFSLNLDWKDWRGQPGRIS